MKIKLSSKIQTDSVVDGVGLRAVVWTQGCAHNCSNCHNVETHDYNKGFFMNIEDLKKEIKDLEYIDGITLSGGDPLFQIDPILELAKYIKNIGLNLWCYTGFTYEEIIKKSKKNIKYYELLTYLDVLVDGKYIHEKRSLNLLFRGSSNQRLIDVQNTLKSNKITLLFDEKKEVKKFEENLIFV